MSSAFRAVYSTVALGKPPGPVGENHIRVASLNKVLLHFLRSAGVGGSLRARQELELRLLAGRVGEVMELLDGLEFAFFKLVKPAAYVPADIDLLVSAADIVRAARRLEEAGFRVVVRERYTITLAGRGVIIDLYRHPSTGGVVFLDGDLLLEHAGPAVFHGARVVSLKPYAEALVSAAHALYKERIYTLNDFLVVSEWADERSFELAKSTGSLAALRKAVEINRLVRDGLLELPYKLPLPGWAALWADKLLSDASSRGSLPSLLGYLSGRRIGKQVYSKLFRESY